MAQKITAEQLIEQARAAGYSAEQLEEMAKQVEILRLAAGIAKIDVDNLAQETQEFLPDIRRQRAAGIEAAARGAPKHEREDAAKQAARLRSSADKLAAPDVDERFKARAASVEFGIRLSAAMRGIDVSTVNIEPALQERLKDSLAEMTSVYRSDGLPPAEAKARVTAALLAEIAAAKKAHLSVSEGVRRWLKSVGVEYTAESGHMKDVDIDDFMTGDAGGDSEQKRAPAPESMRKSGVEEELAGFEARSEAETRREAIEGKFKAIVQSASEKALSSKEQAILSVFLSDDSSFEWKIDEKTQRLAIRRKVRDGVETGDTPAHRLLDVMPGAYANDKAAARAIDKMLSKLETHIKEHLAVETRAALAEIRKGAPERPTVPLPVQPQMEKPAKATPEPSRDETLQALVASLTSLDAEKIQYTKADGQKAEVSGGRYLEAGFKRGFTQLEIAPPNEQGIRLGFLVNQEGKRVQVRNAALRDVLKAAHRLDQQDLSRPIAEARTLQQAMAQQRTQTKQTGIGI
jgi:hypothetical protein